MTARRILVVTLALALGAVAGCTGGDSPGPTGTTTTSPITTPSSTTTTTQADSDEAAVERAIIEFSRLTDELATNPKASLDKLATVSRGESNSQWTQILTNYRRKAWKQVGATSVEVTGVRPQGSSGFTATACLDVSKVNLIDKDGKSVVAAARPPRVAYDYSVTKAGGDYFITKDKVVRTC